MPPRLWFDGPQRARTLVVLAPGAGADCNSRFMTTVASELASRGLRICRFNFPYMERGAKAPDRQPVLEQRYQEVLDELRALHDGSLIAGGKSLGGRVASHVAAANASLDGLVFLGYPLHPPGRPDRLRSAHLPAIKVPMLFVEGTRDPFCPLDTLDPILRSLGKRASLAVIDDGDHSFKPAKASERTVAQAWQEVADAVAGWIDGLDGTAPSPRR